jgi:lipoate-protein ligase A
MDTVKIDDLEKKIADVEKQLHAALGATHKADVNGGMKMVRVPSVHQISNYVESTRKRVKNIEDMEGTTKCAKFLQELQDNHEAQQNG